MPISMDVPDRPQINGPRVVGCTPGKPFLFRIPATGKRPVTFSVTKGTLPPGLGLDPAAGLIDGTVTRPGDTKFTVTAKGPRAGLAGVYGSVREAPACPYAADGLELLERVGHERQCGQGARRRAVHVEDGPRRRWLQLREHRRRLGRRARHQRPYPDEREVRQHDRPLGLCARPGPEARHLLLPRPATCAGYEASYQHEIQDAQTLRQVGHRLSEIRLVLLRRNRAPTDSVGDEEAV